MRIGRHAVRYWETEARVDPQAWAVRRMAEVLALPVAPAPTRDPWSEWSDILAQELNTALIAQVNACWVPIATGSFKARTTYQPQCEARTRRCAPCAYKPLPANHAASSKAAFPPGQGPPRGWNVSARRNVKDGLVGGGASRAQPKDLLTGFHLIKLYLNAARSRYCRMS